MRTIDAAEMTERQTAAIQEKTVQLNVPFLIDLPILPAQQAPGPVWLEQYDAGFLQVLQSGYFNDYQGNQSFWVQFNPIKTGQTQAGFVQQPRLINPLYISLPYTIIIQ